MPTEIPSALHQLEAKGFDISAIKKQILLRERLHELGKPSDLDRMYPLLTSTSWVPHFEDGGKPPLLSNTTIREGAQFRLSNAQKAILRDKCGLTPTPTVTITNLSLFPPEPDGRVYIRSFTILSNLHIDWKNRKHILSSVHIGGRILSPGEFFQKAHTPDHAKTFISSPKPSKLSKLLEEYL